MSYAVTSTGEVFEDSLLGAPGWRIPGWRYATLYYSARTQKRHTYGGTSGTPIFDEANYKKLDSTRVADVSDLEAAIRKANEVFARSAALSKTALDAAGKKFAEQQFVPSTPAPAPAFISTPAPTQQPVVQPAAPPAALPGWVLPATAGVGALFLLTALALARGRAEKA
jgi:hypothetical protein